MIEYRWFGIGMLISGAVFGAVAILVGPAVRTLALLGFFAPFFGIAMYMTVVRPKARAAAAEASVPKTFERETSESTLRRVISIVALQSIGATVLAIVWSIQTSPSGILAACGGAFLGMGAALVLISRWFSRWEDDHSACLLREPRYRWRGDRRSRLGGGGIMDARDFYAESRPGSAP